MNIENHIQNAKNHLDKARDEIPEHHYDTALDMLACAYSNVRELMEHVYELKRSAAAAVRSAEDEPS